MVVVVECDLREMAETEVVPWVMTFGKIAKAAADLSNSMFVNGKSGSEEYQSQENCRKYSGFGVIGANMLDEWGESAI